jgi:hypothetical protein
VVKVFNSLLKSYECVRILLSLREFKGVQIKDHVPFKGERVTKNGKIRLGSFKDIFLKNRWAKKAKIYTKAFRHCASGVTIGKTILHMFVLVD